MRKVVWVSVALLLSAWAATSLAKSAAVQLREGLYAEEVEGNLDSAIKIYQQIINDKSSPKDQVAQALYRQGMCYMKQKNDTEAKADFARIVAEYGDQTDLVAKVKPLLDDLGNADPAALMPPDTLVYVEIGSPGKQVEKILNMLKGTPLENPLAALGGAGQGGNPQQGHAAIMGALLNPSMMAEFKKIRSVGIGVQAISQDRPPAAMVVMYPGKSDALRGILQMIIGLVGRPTESIDGMQTVSFNGGGGAAYDDTVIIVTSPTPRGAEQLKWAVQQYKGLIHEPTLASSNKSFAKVGKKARQDNLLTLWVNADEAYQMLKAMPPDKVPHQIRVADGLVDLQNLDEILATLALQDTGVAFEADVTLKDGHHCMAYNLIRTPHLNTALFKAVPSDATALFAFALGDANSPQAEAAGRQIKNVTGLDIGREIFANIRQVSLFAVPIAKMENPPEGASVFPVGVLGLAITSEDPQQTRQILATLLRAAGMMVPAADGQPQEIKVVNGRFQIDLAKNHQLFGFADDAGKTTVLALSSSTVDGSVKAVRQRSSVLDAGRFKSILAALPPATSKLALVSVAGQMQIAAAHVHLSDPNTNEKVQQAFAQLAQACEQTTVLLRTAEEDNSFDARFEISGLPKADQVIGPIVQLKSVFQSMGGNRWSDEGEPQIPADVGKATVKPVIDGKVDDVWAGAKSYDLANNLYEPVSGPADCSASFQALYDDDNLYILVDVNDDALVHDSPEFYSDDCVEIFIDADNGKADSYGKNDHAYYFVWDATAPVMGKSQQPVNDGTQFAFARTDKGYRLEVQFAWATLKAKPSPGGLFGLDVHVNDDDNGGERDSKLTWHGKQDNAWQSPKAFGTAQLLGLVGWWKLDEKEGRTAADSSGNNHAATVQGDPDWQPAAGKVGGAIALGGDGDFLDVADKAAFNCTGGVTLATWIKAETLDRPWQAIITKGDNAYRLQRNNETNTLEFACTGLQVANDNEYGSLFGSKEIAVDQWYHVAGVYDGRKMCLYMDGVLDASQEASGAIHTNDVHLQIGANTEMGDRFWHGLIDDVRVYNCPLSPAEIATLAAAK
jgi:tetratricopeptide (TPR) repeat protein